MVRLTESVSSAPWHVTVAIRGFSVASIFPNTLAVFGLHVELCSIYQHQTRLRRRASTTYHHCFYCSALLPLTCGSGDIAHLLSFSLIVRSYSTCSSIHPQHAQDVGSQDWPVAAHQGSAVWPSKSEGHPKLPDLFPEPTEK